MLGLQPWQWITFVLIPLIGLATITLVMYKLIRPSQPQRRAVAAPLESERPDVISGRLLDRETLERIGGRIWGKAVQRRYIPDQFSGPIKCVIHKQPLLPGQYFWETPLLDRQTKEPTGDHFAICTACQPGDATAVNHA